MGKTFNTGTLVNGLTVLSNGNVGIGTTNPLSLTNFTSLEVKGTNAGLIAVSSVNGAAFGRMYSSGTTVTIGTSSNHSVVFDTNDTERMRISSGGNVGIGTNSPSYALDINNLGANIALRINQPSSSNSAYNAIYWTGSHTPVLGYVGTGASAVANGALQNAFYMGIANSYPLVFLTSDTERLRIDSAGNITWQNSWTPLNLRPENTPATVITNLASAGATYNFKPGVYWIGYGGFTFLAYVRFNWHQGRNWVLALKCHNVHDMPSGSPLWQNNTLVNQSDFDLNSGRMAKYAAWNYFPFTRLLYQMGDRIPPIMQWNSSRTSLFSVLSGISVGNGSGVGCDSTDPQISTSATTTYYGMANFLGPNFDSAYGGAEVNINFYGLGSFANTASNSTVAGNTGSSAGYGIVNEHLGAFSNLQSNGRAGAWIGCPLDEGAHVFNAPSSPGADSGFGLGVSGGNSPRTTTSGVISWALGASVANYLPAYVWLSID
jgi:hypothetical protein